MTQMTQMTQMSADLICDHLRHQRLSAAFVSLPTD